MEVPQSFLPSLECICVRKCKSLKISPNSKLLLSPTSKYVGIESDKRIRFFNLEKQSYVPDFTLDVSTPDSYWGWVMWKKYEEEDRSNHTKDIFFHVYQDTISFLIFLNDAKEKIDLPFYRVVKQRNRSGYSKIPISQEKMGKLPILQISTTVLSKSSKIMKVLREQNRVVLITDKYEIVTLEFLKKLVLQKQFFLYGSKEILMKYRISKWDFKNSFVFGYHKEERNQKKLLESFSEYVNIGKKVFVWNLQKEKLIGEIRLSEFVKQGRDVMQFHVTSDLETIVVQDHGGTFYEAKIDEYFHLPYIDDEPISGETVLEVKRKEGKGKKKKDDENEESDESEGEGDDGESEGETDDDEEGEEDGGEESETDEEDEEEEDDDDEDESLYPNIYVGKKYDRDVRGLLDLGGFIEHSTFFPNFPCRKRIEQSMKKWYIYYEKWRKIPESTNEYNLLLINPRMEKQILRSHNFFHEEDMLEEEDNLFYKSKGVESEEMFEVPVVKYNTFTVPSKQIKEVVVSEDFVIVKKHEGEGKGSLFQVYNLRTKDQAELNFSKFSKKDESIDTLFLNFFDGNSFRIVTTNFDVFAVVFGHTRKDILKNLLMFENEETARTLCELNLWDSRDLLILTLEIGLENRQIGVIHKALDGVKNDRSQEIRASCIVADYFLNGFVTKDSEFCIVFMRRCINVLTEFIDERFKILVEKKEKDFEKLIEEKLKREKEFDSEREKAEKFPFYSFVKGDPIRGELFPEMISDLQLQGRNYGTYLQKYSKGVSCDLSIHEEILLLSDIIVFFRSHLRKKERKSLNKSKMMRKNRKKRMSEKSSSKKVFLSSSFDEENGGGPSIVDDIVFSLELSTQEAFARWEKLEYEDIMIECLEKGDISMCFSYLKYRKKVSNNVNYTFVDFKRDSFLIVYKFFVSNKFNTGVKVLKNLGENVMEHMKEIAFYTLNNSLRGQLIRELSRKKKLTNEEKELTKYVSLLEQQYTMQSLNSVNDFGQEVSSGKSSNKGKRLNLSLDWVRNWNKNTKERILIDLGLLDSRSSCSKISKLSYALSHFDVKETMEVLRSEEYKMKEEVEVMLDQSNVTHFMREKVLNECAKKGMFLSAEKNSFIMLYNRLMKSKQLLRYRNMDFHLFMIKFAIKRNLKEDLKQYCDTFDLWKRFKENSFIKMNEKIWVRILFLANDHEELNKIYKLSKLNYKMIENRTSNDRISFDEMLKFDPVVGLTTIMYIPQEIKIWDAMNKLDDRNQYYISISQFEESLKNFPTFHREFFPTTSSISTNIRMSGNTPQTPVMNDEDDYFGESEGESGEEGEGERRFEGKGVFNRKSGMDRSKLFEFEIERGNIYPNEGDISLYKMVEYYNSEEFEPLKTVLLPSMKGAKSKVEKLRMEEKGFDKDAVIDPEIVLKDDCVLEELNFEYYLERGRAMEAYYSLIRQKREQFTIFDSPYFNYDEREFSYYLEDEKRREIKRNKVNVMKKHKERKRKEKEDRKTNVGRSRGYRYDSESEEEMKEEEEEEEEEEGEDLPKYESIPRDPRSRISNE